jgi:hypothetical protein
VERLLRESKVLDVSWSVSGLWRLEGAVPYLRARRTIGRAMTAAFFDPGRAYCARRLRDDWERLTGAD